MIELLIFLAGGATGAVAMLLPYNRALSERDMLKMAKDSLAIDVEQLKARNNTLRSDNIELEREVGRIKAEKIAAKPKRGPNGRFIPRVKKPAPISCG